jgi:hypothetical protein
LPYGSVDAGRQPEGIVRTPDETIEQAQRLLDAGRPFHAHEVFEDAWKSSTGPERALWKALAQLAVGLTHLARGNPRGAKTLLQRGSAALAPYVMQPPFGIDVTGISVWATDLVTRIDAGGEPVETAGIAPRLRSAPLN